jgi:peptidoglycan/xylan/chitin deacetylase (PgdA/CDA1 family)
MRILQLLSQTQPTGAETYALTLADWLSEQGHEVFIASDRLHSEVRQTYVPLAVHGNKLSTRLRSTLFLRKFLDEHNIQVIHCHSRAAARLAYWSTIGKKIATVTTLHGRQPISFSKKWHDIYGEKCISICENLTRQVTETLRMNPRKVRLIRNPIRLPAPGEAPAAQAPDTVGARTEAAFPRLAWIGRFSGPKGERAQQFLRDVVPALLAANEALTIDVIGGAPELLGAETLRLVSELRVQHAGRLTVQNFRPDLDRELPRYSLILAAGRIAMSALAQGIPTLAIGEYGSEGIVTLESLPRALASNFGDIGADGAPTGPVDFAAMKAELQKFLHSFPQTAAPGSTPGTTSPTLATPEAESIRALIREEFSHDRVCRKIFNTYKSAYFLKHRPGWIPVLMYHKIPLQPIETQHRIFVTRDDFEKHLQFFKAKGFTTLTFQDLEVYRGGEKDFSDFPKRPLILTFDDGYVDNLENAGPLLKKYDMRAVIYLLCDHSLKANDWDLTAEVSTETAHAIMTLEQKRRLKDFNFEIGSHGFRHQKITEMSEDQARNELALSKAVLESDLGTKVLSYAYTYGVTSPKAATLAEEAGYSFAVNTDSGGLHLEENPYAIFRVNIFPEDGPTQLRKKTATWYRRYFHWKRGR